MFDSVSMNERIDLPIKIKACRRHVSSARRHIAFLLHERYPGKNRAQISSHQ
jgi:hypothetical protein